MASSLNEDRQSLKEENKNSKIYKDLVKTIRGVFEMTLLAKEIDMIKIF